MEQGKKRLATLVGCNYPNTNNELRGCINDVNVMRGLLIQWFGFAWDDIVMLTDQPGSEVLPTGENIRRALEEMIGKADAGDVLLFHYSGHGTMVPSARPHHGSRQEEAIVPCDFNLITDVDFRQLVNQLAAGASLTIVSDSCHSGGLIDKEKEQIGPSTTTTTTHSTLHSHTTPKFLPLTSILSHLASQSNLPSDHLPDHLTHLFGPTATAKYTSNPDTVDKPIEPDNGILLSGCQANETSADMCVGHDVAGAYGAFSNAIRKVVEEEGVMSNRELVTRVRAVLRRQGFSQHPCLYSSDRNADVPFLWWPERSGDDGVLLRSTM